MKITGIEIDDKEACEVITTAFESGNHGIGYWATALNYKRNDEADVVYLRIADTGDNENWKTAKKHTIDAAVVRKGLAKLIEPGFDISDNIRASILEWDIDAEAADCIIQAALFGELVYG